MRQILRTVNTTHRMLVRWLLCMARHREDDLDNSKTVAPPPPFIKTVILFFFQTPFFYPVFLQEYSCANIFLEE